jgi:hypothetical protein
MFSDVKILIKIILVVLLFTTVGCGNNSTPIAVATPTQTPTLIPTTVPTPTNVVIVPPEIRGFFLGSERVKESSELLVNKLINIRVDVVNNDNNITDYKWNVDCGEIEPIDEESESALMVIYQPPATPDTCIISVEIEYSSNLSDHSGSVSESLILKIVPYNRGKEETPASAPSDTPVPEPTASDTPTPEPTPKPNDTPIPDTPTPQPENRTNTPVTIVDTPTPTFTPIPTAINYPAPTLINPIAKTNITGKEYLFEWEWPGQLQSNHAFEIRIWHVSDPMHYGAHNATDGKPYLKPDSNGRYRGNVSVEGAYAQQLHHNSPDYFWAVAIVEINPYTQTAVVESTSIPIEINISGGGSSGGSNGGSGDPTLP